MNPPRWIFIIIMAGFAVTTISVMGTLQERRLVAPNGIILEPIPVATQDASILEPDASLLAEMGLSDSQLGS